MLKDKHADILSYGYSRELADLIMSCVQTDPSLRPNFYFLLKTLAQLDSDR